MKPTGLGHERVKSPATACARVEAWSTERTGRRASAASRRGVLSGRVVSDGESPLHGEGPDGSTQPAQETRAGRAGPGHHVPTSLRGIANRARESKHKNWCLFDPFARAKASTTEEPDAGKLHVRVCGGGSG
jgi:hypothetical protein